MVARQLQAVVEQMRMLRVREDFVPTPDVFADVGLPFHVEEIRWKGALTGYRVKPIIGDVRNERGRPGVGG